MKVGLGISLGPLTQIQFFSVQSDTEDKRQTDKQWMDMQQREGPGQRSGNQKRHRGNSKGTNGKQRQRWTERAITEQERDRERQRREHKRVREFHQE